MLVDDAGDDNGNGNGKELQKRNSQNVRMLLRILMRMLLHIASMYVAHVALRAAPADAHVCRLRLSMFSGGLHSGGLHLSNERGNHLPVL